MNVVSLGIKLVHSRSEIENLLLRPALYSIKTPKALFKGKFSPFAMSL